MAAHLIVDSRLMFATIPRPIPPSVLLAAANVQLFPTNVIDGAKWPGDFEEKGNYAVQVR